jgi:hypothetical protein
LDSLKFLYLLVPLLDFALQVFGVVVRFPHHFQNIEMRQSPPTFPPLLRVVETQQHQPESSQE